MEFLFLISRILYETVYRSPSHMQTVANNFFNYEELFLGIRRVDFWSLGCLFTGVIIYKKKSYETPWVMNCACYCFFNRVNEVPKVQLENQAPQDLR